MRANNKTHIRIRKNILFRWNYAKIRCAIGWCKDRGNRRRRERAQNATRSIDADFFAYYLVHCATVAREDLYILLCVYAKLYNRFPPTAAEVKGYLWPWELQSHNNILYNELYTYLYVYKCIYIYIYRCVRGYQLPTTTVAIYLLVSVYVCARTSGKKDEIFVKFECENMLRTVIEIRHTVARKHPFVAFNSDQSL
jgi:hypothetical protein